MSREKRKEKDQSKLIAICYIIVRFHLFYIVIVVRSPKFQLSRPIFDFFFKKKGFELLVVIVRRKVS